MRNCPLCKVLLERIRYEGFPVHKCPSCHGALLENKRIEHIKRKMDRSLDELVGESNAERANNTVKPIRCPRCHNTMQKHEASADDMASFKVGLEPFCVDVCTQCDITWLDGGELAKMQIDYEASPKGREAAKHYVSYDELDAAGKAKFVRTIAGATPDSAAQGVNAFASAISHVLYGMRRRSL